MYNKEASWPTEPEYRCEEDFRQALKSWGKVLIQNQIIDIHTQARANDRHDRWVQTFWCGACSKCIDVRGRPTGQGWQGFAYYDRHQKVVCVKYTEMSKHGGFDRFTGAAKLTNTAKHKAAAIVKGSPVTAQALLNHIMDSQPTAPREIKLPAFIKNLRVNGAACQKPPKMRWAKCDWLQLLRGLPRFEDLSEQNWDGCPLCWVSTDTLLDDPKQIAIVLCCPALVRQVFKRLHNTEHIKLCGDGTFNMMRDAWVLLSLGVISKRFRRGEESHLEAFRSHFTGFMFCIANKESKHTYGAFFSACKRVVSAVSGIDLAVQCKQYHADWHKGEEIARTAEFHSSIRVGDYAHFVGATTKASRSRCTTGRHNQPGHEAQMKCAWRTGIYETIQRAAPSRLAGVAAVEKVKPWVETTVASPSLLLFHVAWLLVLQDLEISGFAWCSTLLQKCYLIKLSANDAREQWRNTF